jgi:glutamyl-tRNA(Gln) amidotransferase subunit D
MKTNSTGQLSYADEEIDKDDLLARFKELHSLVDINSDDIVNLGSVSRKDSSNIDPSDWEKIAKEAADSLNRGYDGVLITHGTDSMHYTSAALSFMLKGFTKTIALTGSQIAVDEENSDAPKNIYDAANAAAYGRFGVCIVFASKIIRGTRARKTSSKAIDAFDSFCAPLLGSINDIPTQHQQEKLQEKIEIDAKMQKKVGYIKVFPGINPDILDWYIDCDYKGIIIEGLGAGHANTDTNGLSFVPGAKRAKEAGVPVFMCTQCNGGKVDLRYEVGAKLHDAGVVGLGDMLPEVAITKLMYVTGQYKDAEIIKTAMLQNMAGEINL